MRPGSTQQPSGLIFRASEVILPIPTGCPNPICRAHFKPDRDWMRGYGVYQIRAHGRVCRFQCRTCGTTCSSQTESMHFAARRRLPLSAITAQAIMLSYLTPRRRVVFDGLRSFVTSQDYPCDLTTVVDTDRHEHYRRIVERSLVYRFLRQVNVARHRRTSSRAAHTADNPLFPVNYVDRLIRHRLREHTRETIAFGRHSAMQLHRMWLFAWDLNTQREWRAKRPESGTYAAQGSLDETGVRAMRRVNREFYQRRIDVRGCAIPDSFAEAWQGRAVTPPV